jgi:site-specific DNA-adenine methylase
VDFVKVHGIEEYIEPFAGMGAISLSVAQRLPGLKVSVGDLNKDVFNIWEGAINDISPPPHVYSEDERDRTRRNKSRNFEESFIHFSHSFGGVPGAGYYPRFHRNATNSYNKLRGLARNFTLKHQSYKEWNPMNALVYCDPPYAGTKISDYVEGDRFDFDLFWQTMVKWAGNNIVLVSWSASAPVPPFVKNTLLWSKTQTRVVGAWGKECIEQLFRVHA